MQQNLKFKHLVNNNNNNNNNNNKVMLIPIATGVEGLGNKRTNRDHPNYDIVKIGQNTDKSPGDLRRLAVTQTSEKQSVKTCVENSRE